MCVCVCVSFLHLARDSLSPGPLPVEINVMISLHLSRMQHHSGESGQTITSWDTDLPPNCLHAGWCHVKRANCIMCVLDSFFRAVSCVNLLCQKSFSLQSGFTGIVGGCHESGERRWDCWGLTEKCNREKATTGFGYICAPTDPNATVDNKTMWERLVDHRGVVRNSSS